MRLDEVRLPGGIRRLFRLGGYRPEVTRDVDDEIDFHLRQVVERLVADGASPGDAEREARARFGDTRAYREALRRIDERRVAMRERSETIDSVVRTIRFAFRSLRRSPGFAFAVATILALGIGANAVMFGVVDRLLLSPPQGIDDWQGVRHVYLERSFAGQAPRINRTLTFPDYRDFQEVSGWSSVAAYTHSSTLTMGDGERAMRVRAAMASASLFPMLGVQPALGRFYTVEEDEPGAAPTAVLSHEFWEREFGSDGAAIGETLRIGDGRFTVVGVAPEGFTGVELAPVDVWLPLETAQAISTGSTQWVEHRNWWWLAVAVRLADGATDEATTAQATALHRSGRADQIAEDDYDAGARILTAPIIAARGPTPTDEASVARWLAGVSLIVLFIACLNVANLLLARGLKARREVAVRLALGVSRRRLVAESLTETLLLAGLGSTLALLVAAALSRPLHEILLPDVSFNGGAISGRLLLFTGIAAALAVLLAGAIPATHASRPELMSSLKTTGKGSGRRRSRTRVALLVGQAALSVVLLVGAGLFVRSLGEARGLDLGFDPESVAVIELEWNETLPGSEREAVYRAALESTRRLPGVRAAGLAYTLPFWSSVSLGPPRAPGRDSIAGEPGMGFYVNKISSGYLEAMGLSILRGRALEPSDDVENAPPVTILSESMANLVWPNETALGQCLYVGEGENDEEPFCTEVVGIVENHRRQDLVGRDEYLYYLNQAHPSFQGPPQAMVAGTSGPADDALGMLRSESASSSPLVRFSIVRPLQQHIDPHLRSWKLGASMFSVFGLLALLVAAYGLYSVLAFEVALQRHELGVRAALGAGGGRLVQLVLARAIALVVAGTAIGLAVSWAAAGRIEDLLFETSAQDPTIYGTVAVALLLVAAVAGFLPAWRATRVDPIEALRAE